MIFINMSKHNKISKEEKTKIVLAALREDKTINEIAMEYSVHPNLISRWRQTATEGMPELFEDKRSRVDRKKFKEQEELIDRLYKLVGQRDTELDWLKKKFAVIDDKRTSKTNRQGKQ